MPEPSTKCASCRKDKKKCVRIGKFRCNRCKDKGRKCIIQCLDCYEKNKTEKDVIHCCPNCKTVKEGDYDFITDDDGKTYLLSSDGVKFEITPGVELLFNNYPYGELEIHDGTHDEMIYTTIIIAIEIWPSGC
ncbi:28157_t:CDS:2 [Dentiscutata erythropus]|uniref:28157_t:CDS:1 n=1 Tax=Dentiscutata erythropus TaxID=1348616 RepID=A0A9N8WEK7_9GLOM|nr:28157_t:CDS:2 [Dentiscutata erythropus]